MLIQRWQVRLLGAVEVLGSHGRRVPFATHKSALVFGYLASRIGADVSRLELQKVVWPDAEQESAAHSLRQALSSLRKTLEPPGVAQGSVLQADRRTARLNPEALVLDVLELANAVSGGEPTELARALDSHFGEFMPGFDQAWVKEERRRVADLYSKGVKKLAGAYRGQGDYVSALPYARRAVEMNPLDEDAQGLLIRLYATLGRPEDAVRQYRELRRLLRREYGDDPDPGLREIVLSLKDSAGKLVMPDLDEEVAEPAIPPTRALQRKGSLPVHLTGLVGRSREIKDVCDLLDPSSSVRLMTVIGPGGCGKTRLSVEAAHRLDEGYGKRVWFANLADLTDVRSIPARLLGLIRAKGTSEAVDDQLAEALGEGPSLIVLDNMEQLLPQGAHVVEQLLHRLPSLRLLTTSRRPLSLPGERKLSLPPLELPADSLSEAEAMHCESIRLFVLRAQEAWSEFALTTRNLASVAEICRQLEGLPLAIELAAARSATVRPARMLTLLEERFELLRSKPGQREDRHASLWAAIDWTYQMLSPSAAKLLRQLSVFRGGWTMDACEEVCAEPEALRVLEELRTHAIIRFEQAEDLRYSMLESIRDFAEDQISGEERTVAALRHAEFFGRRAKVWHDAQRGEEAASATETLRVEQDNLTAVIERSKNGALPIELGYAVANFSYRYWEMRGMWAEARRTYESLLAADASAEPTPQRALALISLSNLMRQQGDVLAAVPLTEECLQTRRRLGDRAGEASALGHMAQLRKASDDFDSAKRLFLECIAIQEEIGAEWSVGMNYLNLGWLLLFMGQFEESREWLEKSRAMMRKLGDQWGLAAAAGNLGELAFRQGDLDEAERWHLDSITGFIQIEDRPAIAEELEAFAAVYGGRNDLAWAARTFGAADGLRHEIGVRPTGSEKDVLDQRIAQVSSALGHERFEELWEEGRALGWRAVCDRLLAVPERSTK